MLKILRIFYGFLLRRKWFSVVFFVLIIAAPAASSITPYFYKFFVDAIPKNDFRLLLYILVAYILVRSLALILHTLAYFIGDVILIDGSQNARVKVFKHIQDLDFAFHTSKSTGSLISIMKRGDGAFFSLYFSIHFRIVEVLIGFLVMFYAFSKIDFRISLFVLISFAISLIISKLLVALNIRERANFNREEDKISAIIVDNMINFETVKLFSKELWERERLNKTFKIWRKYFWRYANSFRLFDLSIGSLVNLSTFLVLFAAIYLVKEVDLSVGEFVLIVGFAGSVYPQVFDLVFSFRDIAKHYADIERYFGILENEIQIKDSKKPVRLKKVDGEILFENVSFSYENNREETLRNVNLHIRQGQSVALVGRSGAGKTTIVKLLMRFYDLNKGKISIDGVNIKKMTKSNLRSLIGVVPQEPILFDNTITYNIAYGKSGATKKEVVAAAKMANIHEFIESLLKKYNTRVGERGIKLSGGQKQRLAIARMILADPDIIIFDEATSHLDSESEKLIQDAFWKATKNKTTIIIAHRLSTVIRADKIILMDKGSIVEEGSHSSLLQKKVGLYKKFWRMQSV